ncbi:MAG: pirin family protein [Bacteroidota bacterium]|jgi:redox-sensitive bicupin YhaK (pirin superfamily)
MSNRSIQKIISPIAPHFVGDGFRVHNFIPSAPGLDMQRMNPFIMLDYNAPVYFPPSEIPRGVDVHPHRGFETVTIAYKGRVEHHDSSGGGGVIGEGDVQWMTAASGVLHKEFHEQAWSKEGGYFQMVQLWVNLPAQFKMSAPKYQAISNNLMNKFMLENDLGIVEVIAGKYEDVLGSATTFTPIYVYNAKLKSGASLPFQFPSHFNTALLVIEGAITIQEQSVPVNHFVLMANDGEDFSITTSEDCIVLVLSGEPIQEPIAAHGPFVMNTREELIQAFDDYQQGKFGSL